MGRDDFSVIEFDLSVIMAEAIRSDSDDTHNSNTEKCNQSSESLFHLSETLKRFEFRMAEAFRTDSDDTHNSNTVEYNQRSTENLSDLIEILKAWPFKALSVCLQKKELSVCLQKISEENSVRRLNEFASSMISGLIFLSCFAGVAPKMLRIRGRN